MLSDRELLQQLEYVLVESNLDFLGERYVGKVRDNYTKGNCRYLITSDRLSCFDVVLTSIPFKGQVLTEMAYHWFKASEDIVTNHLIDMPDPNVLVVKNCQMLPVEVVVRAYLAGSAWRDYAAGKEISGVKLPLGLKSSQQLPEIIVTPSTKAELGQHDAPISEKQIVSSGLVSSSLWTQVKEVALALFKRGTEMSAKQGLLLVDTKYEFGLADGKLTLVDEIHTLDCSRFWKRETYQSLFDRGEAPEMLDKEPIRQWLISRGYKGEGIAPEFTSDHRVQVAKDYIGNFCSVVGRPFVGQVGPVLERITNKLQSASQV